MLWAELPRFTPQGCPYEHSALREPSGHPPEGDDVRVLFARCRIGLRTAADPCGIGTDARAFCRGVFPRLPTRFVFARPPCGAVGYSRPSDLGFTPHRGGFHPDVTPTLGLGRSILFNHRPSKATAKCSRPTVFRVATPTHRSLRTHYDPACAFTLPGSAASGLVRGRFPCTQGFAPRHTSWRSSVRRPIDLPART